jgi:hypothetical protein
VYKRQHGYSSFNLRGKNSILSRKNAQLGVKKIPSRKTGRDLVR